MGCENCRRASFESMAVDVPGMDRRGFLERATLAAVAVVLAGCDMTSPTGLPSGGPYTVQLDAYPALAHVGGVARVNLEGGSVIGVGRVTESQFDAYGLSCTHEGTQVRVQGDRWVCPSHGAVFDTAGRAVAGPTSRALVSVPVSYDAAAGTLTVN